MNTHSIGMIEAGDGQLTASPNRVRDVKKRGSRGFTLIEAVVVVAVLTILAMLLLPRFTFIRVLSTYANQAASIKDVTHNMLIHHATQAVWPTRFDSLIESDHLYGWDGSTIETDGLSTGLTNVLETVTLSAKQKKSLMQLLGQTTNGVNTLILMDHAQSTTLPPGDSGTVERDIATSSDLVMAKVKVDSSNYSTAKAAAVANSSFDPNEPSPLAVYESVFPNGYNPNGDILVAVGVGPACTAIGKTMITAPQAYLKDSTRYNRTLVLLRLNGNGVAASLAGGLSPDGRTLAQSVGAYRVFAER